MNHEYVAEEFELRGYTVKIIQDQDAENPRKGFDNFGTMVCWHNRYNLGDETRTDDPYTWMDELAEEVQPGIVEWLDNGLYSRTVTTHGYSGVEAEVLKHVAQVSEYKKLRAARIQAILDKHYIMRPLGLLDHSGLHMWIGSGPHWTDSAGWDSGQVGWIYITRKKAIAELGGEWENGVNVKPAKRMTKKIHDIAVKNLGIEVETYDQYLTGQVYGYVIEDSDGDDVDSCWGFFGLDYAISEAKSAVPDEPCMMGGEGADNAMEATLA